MRDYPSVLVSISSVRCYGVPTAPSSTSAQEIDNRLLDDSNPQYLPRGARAMAVRGGISDMILLSHR